MVSDGQLANRLVPCKDPRESNYQGFPGVYFPGAWGTGSLRTESLGTRSGNRVSGNRVSEQGLWGPARLKRKHQNQSSEDCSQVWYLFQISAFDSCVGFRVKTPCGGVFTLKSQKPDLSWYLMCP